MEETPGGLRLSFRIIVMIVGLDQAGDIRFEQALDDQQGRRAGLGADSHTKLQAFGQRFRTHQGTGIPDTSGKACHQTGEFGRSIQQSHPGRSRKPGRAHQAQCNQRQNGQRQLGV
ncbi:MAG: hypothetical protein A2X71_01560 [Thiobacillus sp. GWE1_62_9]|nr:MAG: hypothetical protein A2X71_01560 [Thiobacillus sp. GWE1_62_9]HBU30162.1 hypothetical protein [Thiobacillus sp.]